MTFEWLLFYGHMLNMSRQETIHTRYGEMLDMISCLSVYNGGSEVVENKRKMRFEEAMRYR